jgi:hypothetical protein
VLDIKVASGLMACNPIWLLLRAAALDFHSWTPIMLSTGRSFCRITMVTEDLAVLLNRLWNSNIDNTCYTNLFFCEYLDWRPGLYDITFNIPNLPLEHCRIRCDLITVLTTLPGYNNDPWMIQRISTECKI